MNSCPFCGFDEGWVRESPWNIIEKRNPNDIKYVIQCHVCSAIGPESVTEEGAEKKWNGYLKDDIDSADRGAMQMAIEEDVSSPMSTLTNTPGMGTAVPPSQTSNGSGDKWGNEIEKKKKKTEEETNEDFYPSIKEENINPYDKLGTAIAKKMKVPMTFKKGKNQTVKQKKIK